MSDDRPPKAASGNLALVGFAAGVLTVIVVVLIVV